MLHFSAAMKPYRRLEIGWQSGHWCVGILWLEGDLVNSWKLWYKVQYPRIQNPSENLLRREKLRGFLRFVIGLSRELVGYGGYANDHRLLIHRVMLLPLVIRVMWFGRGEAFWRY